MRIWVVVLVATHAVKVLPVTLVLHLEVVEALTEIEICYRAIAN
jgi:hypothetical protein